MEKNRKVLVMLVLLWSVLGQCVYAGISVPAAEKEPLPQNYLGKDSQYPGRKGGWTKQDLIDLKEKDPERFGALANQWKNKVAKQLEYIKYTDPKKYAKIMQYITMKRLKNLIRLRKEDPAKFRDLIAKRREKIKQQLQYLKNNNPVQYQRIVNHIHKLQALNQLRKNNPKEFQKFLEQYPVLRKQLFRLQYGI